MAVKQITSMPSASPEGKCVAKIREVQGKSLVWNQIADAQSAISNTYQGVTVTRAANDNLVTVTGTSTSSERYIVQVLKIPSPMSFVGHKILVKFLLLKGTLSASYRFTFRYNGWTMQKHLYSNSSSTIVTLPAYTSGGGAFVFLIENSNGVTFDIAARMYAIDLTLMFGAGNEPSTVEEFEAMFPENYYEYNSGEIINSNINAIETVGFNQWDEEWELGSLTWVNGANSPLSTEIRSKNFITCLPNTEYFFKTGASGRGYLFFYDANKTFISYTQSSQKDTTVTTPQVARFIRFFMTDTYGTTYKHDICINLSDASRNGTYEPYKKSTLPLNISTLTGKLNGEGESVIICPEGLKSVGSVYDEGIIENGFMTKIIKRVGSVDLGTLSWTRKTSTSYGGEWSFFWTEDYNFKKPIIGTIATICDIYEGIPVYPFSSTSCKMRTTNKTCLLYTDSVFYVRDDSYTDSETFKAAMSGVLINYELATPLEYVLDTPILMEYNTDGGTEQIVFSENLLSTPLVADVDYFNTAIKHIQFSDETHCIRDERITGVDYIPTEHSTNVVTSAGIYNAISGFSKTDTKVTQTVTTTSANYEVLLSGTADNTTRTEGARKNSNLTFNPSTGNLQTTQLNGVAVGSSPKFTDTTYSSKTAASGGTDVSLVTTGEKYTWNNKGTGTITKVGNTTSGAVTVSSANNTASFGSAVTVGSVGGVDLKFTMPANPNSDTKVTQTVTSSSNTSWRPLLLGYSYSDAATFAPTTVTNTTLASHLGKFAPKTGILGIVGLNKMTTSGTIETGSNTTVWNTNGGTTSLSGYLTSHQAVSSNNNTATWGSTVTVGKVGSTDLKFTMPSNPVSNLLNGTSTQFVKGDGSFDSNSYLPENQAILSRMQDDATHRTVTDTDKTNWNNKQSTLISGSNIKTINNTSILGSGNISIPSGKSAYEIWLDAGNTGTESDFLESLKGNSGYSGAAGELQVVNDLTTGGATAALSAEMGKLLADAIGAPTLIDLNEITAISNGYAISSTTKLWISRSDSKYILIPVENFYKVTVTANSSGVSALAWLKDTPIPVAGETPNYSEGTELWLQQANTIETYTVPTDAKFLYSFVAARYPAKVIGIKYNSTYNKNQFEPNLKTYSPITGSYINVTTYKWDNQNSTWSHIMIPNANYQSVTVKSNSSYGSRIAFLTNNDETAGSTPSYAENTSLYKPESGETNNYLIPSSTNWIYIYTGVDYGHLPESVVFYTDDSNSVNSIINTSSENDFEIVDKNKNPIVVFNNGHIKTLNFDSSKLVKTSNYTRRNFFSYNVNCTNFLTTNFTASSINYYDPIALYEDNAILYLPASYSNQGPKTKLIIYCKEGSTYMTEDHDSILTNPEVTRYFLYQGYAILAADGVPDGWKEALKIGERAVGNYVAVQSTLRAFEYVKNNYNIDCDNVFIFGYSQGGMYAENVIDNTDLPIRAAVLLSPALSMRYHQWDAPLTQTINGTSYTKAARLNIARIFNFPEFTTNAQLLALEYDADKVCGYDPWVRNVDNPYDGFIKGTSVGTELWGLPSGTSLDSITMKKYTKCPTKIWVAENDNALGVDITKVFVKAIRNTGQVADLQLFSTGEHHIQNYQTAIRTFVENGENVSLLPLYLDMAAWYYNFGGLELK